MSGLLRTVPGTSSGSDEQWFLAGNVALFNRTSRVGRFRDPISFSLAPGAASMSNSKASPGQINRGMRPVGPEFDKLEEQESL